MVNFFFGPNGHIHENYSKENIGKQDKGIFGGKRGGKPNNS